MGKYGAGEGRGGRHAARLQQFYSLGTREATIGQPRRHAPAVAGLLQTAARRLPDDAWPVRSAERSPPSRLQGAGCSLKHAAPVVVERIDLELLDQHPDDVGERHWPSREVQVSQR